MLLGLLAIIGCGGEPPKAPEREVRPVAVMELQPRNPAVSLDVMGSAAAWKEERVGFELTGRVAWVVLENTEVNGPRFLDDGTEVPDTGDVIATLEDERYRIALAAARAELDQTAKNGMAAAAKRDATKARLDATKARRRAGQAGVAASEAKITIVNAKVDSAKASCTQFTSVLDGAKVRARQAEAEFQRAEQLSRTGAATPQQLDKARADFDAAKSKVVEADAACRSAVAALAMAEAEVLATQAEVEAKKAELESLAAEVAAVIADIASLEANIELIAAQGRQLEQKVESATLDVERCKLRAPFTGRVSRVHLQRGALVAAGTPAVTLTVMDPINVELAVSAATERQIRWRDTVLVTPPGGTRADALEGVVYLDSSKADPMTHTFKVEVIMRNRQVLADGTVPQELLGVPVAQGLWLVYTTVPFTEQYGASIARSGVNPVARGGGGPQDEPRRPANPVQINVPIIFGGCMMKKKGDPTGVYVWRATNLGDEGGANKQLVKFERVQVHLLKDPATGELAKRVIGGTLMFFALDPRQPMGDLKPGDNLLAATPDVAVQQDDGSFKVMPHEEAPDTGVMALQIRSRWLFRPGDLVGVELKRESPGEGLYVPLDVIVLPGGKPHVFLVVNENGTDVAKRVPVNVTAQVRDLRRIEGDGIAPGARVVTDGAQFLVPDQPIRVVSSQTPQDAPGSNGGGTEVGQ
ncbi:MAG: HlyD family efflux transporter periplasmic adaptor subunit [Planctomycetota bacterium]